MPILEASSAVTGVPRLLRRLRSCGAGTPEQTRHSGNGAARFQYRHGGGAVSGAALQRYGVRLHTGRGVLRRDIFVADDFSYTPDFSHSHRSLWTRSYALHPLSSHAIAVWRPASQPTASFL